MNKTVTARKPATARKARPRARAADTNAPADSAPSSLPLGATDSPFTEGRYCAQDGLELAYSDYGPRHAPHTPVLCLAGLTRNARDFHELASYLATIPGHERRVIAPDYRGRGRSAHDRNWKNYTVGTEVSDVIDLLTVLQLEHVIVVGTSRGGILAMLMGSARPGVLKGVVLNDIGPHIEPQGLLRIRQYMRERPTARSWDEAADALKRMWQSQFPALNDAGWLRLAHKIYIDQDGRILPAYDPDLLKPMDELDLSVAPPPLWAQFGSLTNIPVLTLRGEHSDILTAQTVSDMRKVHPRFQSATVPDSGHAPLLIETPVLRRIADFIHGCG